VIEIFLGEDGHLQGMIAGNQPGTAAAADMS